MELCVFGAASDAVPEVYITQTELLGERIAARGHDLLFGGGATGMMGAVPSRPPKSTLSPTFLP